MIMTIKQIRKLQKEYGADELQSLIDSGTCWHLEGFVGRQAMDALKSGACYLPAKRYTDHYGSTVPSREDLEPGTTGTIKNSIEFWTKVEDGEIEI